MNYFEYFDTSSWMGDCNIAKPLPKQESLMQKKADTYMPRADSKTRSVFSSVLRPLNAIPPQNRENKGRKIKAVPEPVRTR
jgi:hypothetical protein